MKPAMTVLHSNEEKDSQINIECSLEDACKVKDILEASYFDFMNRSNHSIGRFCLYMPKEDVPEFTTYFEGCMQAAETLGDTQAAYSLYARDKEQYEIGIDLLFTSSGCLHVHADGRYSDYVAKESLQNIVRAFPLEYAKYMRNLFDEHIQSLEKSAVKNVERES